MSGVWSFFPTGQMFRERVNDPENFTAIWGYSGQKRHDGRNSSPILVTETRDGNDQVRLSANFPLILAPGAAAAETVECLGKKSLISRSGEKKGFFPRERKENSQGKPLLNLLWPIFHDKTGPKQKKVSVPEEVISHLPNWSGEKSEIYNGRVLVTYNVWFNVCFGRKRFLCLI